MKNKYLSIGEMARLNKTTIPTLRFYDECDLLKPCYTNPDNNYRYYDIKQSARLDMIQYMKELGLDLKEIKQILFTKDLDKIEMLLNEKLIETLKQIEVLKAKKNAIKRASDNIEKYKHSPGVGAITVEYMDSRRIYAVDVNVNFYEDGIVGYELLLKKLKEELLNHHIPPVYYCNVGTFLRREDFCKLNFVSHKMFIFIDDLLPGNVKAEEISGGLYACVYVDKFEDEQKYATQLLQYCCDKGYEISGDYICEVVTEWNSFDCEQRSMFFRIQVPIILE